MSEGRKLNPDKLEFAKDWRKSKNPYLRHAAKLINLDSHSFDICYCGDYKHQHDLMGCRICRGSKAPYDGCVKFRLANGGPQ